MIRQRARAFAFIAATWGAVICLSVSPTAPRASTLPPVRDLVTAVSEHLDEAGSVNPDRQAAAVLRAHRSCAVPSLKGDTLAAARRALSAARCRLGSLHAPALHRGALRVIRQSPRAGNQLARGARVGVWTAATGRSAGQRIYVANSEGDSITEYAATARGNVSPTKVIRGPNTGLRGPDGLAVDSAGTIYVANFGGASVTEYGSGARGDASPVRTIRGARTTLDRPWGIGVNSSGILYVTNRDGSRIVEFESWAGGDIGPGRTIGGSHTSLYEAWGLAFDASGTVYVSNGSSINNAITEYARGANGNVTPNHSISGGRTHISAPNGEGFDRSGTLYVCNNGNPNSVTAYAPGVTGSASPLRIISGVGTKLDGCAGLAVH